MAFKRNCVAAFGLSILALVAASGVTCVVSFPLEGEGNICGGLAGQGCNPGLYCHYEDGTCGAADQTGVCERQPDLCTMDYSPVCGCDDRTYANACQAAAAGVSINHHGPCGSGQVCGGLAGVACPQDEYCRYEVGTCGYADQQGVCEPVPDTCPELYAPVCGCDGRTYSNECEAARAGISIDHTGPCS